ncbi:hypothetical protein [Paraburkholderia sp.]|uniref:type IV pilus modification PilV family protein n=1 Tax=Paraburkholderia sp. TaxID=1926495 RepID=UPI0025EB6CF4|nr:hypothetical protein [Paraburkholderia sp.]
MRSPGFGCARGYARGTTLLEVALAMGVMAMCALGLMSTQLALARHAQSAAVRERAAFAADAIVESSTFTGGLAVDAWKARARTIVPDGLAAIPNQSAEASIAVVTWAFTGNAFASGAVMPPSNCSGASIDSGRDCVALTFAR